MKHPSILPLQLLATTLFAFASASASVPLRWTVETSRAVPATFEAYQGETLAFEAALQSYGKPLAAPSEYSLYWQTNGMGNAWWSQEVVGFSGSGTMEGSNSTVPLQTTTTTNVLFATWSPTNDVGAKVYNCFIGKPGTIYHAAFQLRLRPSPGATPNELPLPQKVIDFAKVTVLNPPWPTNVTPEAVREIVQPMLDGYLPLTGGTIDDDLSVESSSGAGVSLSTPDGLSGQVSIYAEDGSAGSADLYLTGADGGSSISIRGTGGFVVDFYDTFLFSDGGAGDEGHFGFGNLTADAVLNPDIGWEGDVAVSLTGSNSTFKIRGSDVTTKADVNALIASTNPNFSGAVLQTVVSSLSTNITEEVYIAATNACANIGIDPALIPGVGTTGTVGGFIVVLFAVVFSMRKKIFDNSGKVTDAFANDLLTKQVSIQKVQNIVNEMFDNGDTTAYPRTTGEG